LEEDCGLLKIKRFSGRNPDLRNYFFSADAPKKSDPPHMSPDLILQAVLHSSILLHTLQQIWPETPDLRSFTDHPDTQTPPPQRARARCLAPGSAPAVLYESHKQHSLPDKGFLRDNVP